MKPLSYVALVSLVVGGSAVLVGHVGLPQTRQPYPACATEDSAGPCYWDATKSGNGLGRSFTVEADGSVTYLNPRQEGLVRVANNLGVLK